MKPTLRVRPYHHDPKFRFVLDLRAFKKGRRFFKTRNEAEAEALRQRTLLEIHSREAVGLDRREMTEIITAKKKLSEYGKTITDAADFFLDHLTRVRRCRITVAQLAEEVVEAKRKDGCSAKYLVMLRFYFKRFCQDFGNRPIAGIDVDELDDWLRALQGAPQTRMDYRTALGVLFSYAVKRRMLESNPVAFTAKPKLVDRPPEIFKVDELQALLEAARQTEPSILPMLAIGAFAGLREAEIQRLDWSEVDLVRGHIEVTARKAKSARRRIVPVQPNLASWLRPYSEMTGLVVPIGARRMLKLVRQTAGLTRWPQNGLRSSFASYRPAATNNAALVASELGHASAQMLFAHYRELVHPSEAERYWKIVPAVEAGKVVAFAGS
jgi:integrase